MPVRRDKRGRWMFRHVVELPPDHSGKRDKRRIYGTAPRHCNTKAAAEQAMFEAIERLMHPERFPTPQPAQPEHKEVPTFREFVEERFLAYTKARNSTSEMLSKESIFAQHLFPAFGEMRLDEIRPLEIEDYKREKLENGRIFKGPAVKSGRVKKPGLSKKTIDNHLIVLRRVLNVAREWEIIERAPKVELYRPKDAPFDFLDFAEAEQLAGAAATLPARLERDRFAVGAGDWGRMIALGLKTGMRIGELLALRWANVRLEARKVHVCEATTRGVVGLPKGGKVRDIPLSRQALATVRAQRHLRGPRVFCEAGGEPLGYDQCKKPLALACERAGLRKVGWHALRHTFASHLVMRGVPLKAVQELLGHASIEMTMRYAHLAPAVRQAAVEALDDPAPGPAPGLGDREPGRG